MGGLNFPPPSGPSKSPLGALQGRSWGALGSVLGPSWAPLGALLGHLRARPKRCFGEFVCRFRFDFVLRQRRNEDSAKENENEKPCLGPALRFSNQGEEKRGVEREGGRGMDDQEASHLYLGPVPSKQLA